MPLRSMPLRCTAPLAVLLPLNQFCSPFAVPRAGCYYTMLAQPRFFYAASIHYQTRRVPLVGPKEKKMLERFRSYGFLIVSLSLLLLAAPGRPQGNSGLIEGVVKDQSG